MAIISFKEILNRREQHTVKQRKALDYLLSIPEECGYITIRELARRVGVTEVSILRMSRALGFGGFMELKDALRHYLPDLQSLARDQALRQREADLGDELNLAYASMVGYERKNLEDLYTNLRAEQLFDSARAILQADEVMLIGHTSSKVLADFFTIRLNYLQIKASSIKLDDSFYVQSSLARLKKNDIVILFSFSPYYLPIYNVARYAEHKGARVISITDSLQSPALSEKGFNFICRTNTRFFFNSQTATVSLINLLTSSIALEMGENLDLIQSEENTVSRFLNSGIPR